MRRYIEIYSIMLRNSLIRDLSFKANFLLWMVVEILWFCGQIVFFSIIFGNVDHIGDWTKWEVVLLIGTHQIIAQLFQAFFFVNLANIPELVRMGKLDSVLVLPIDSQFAVSTKQFGLDSIVNALLGAAVVVCLAVQAERRAERTFRFALCCGAWFRSRRALLHHARPGCGELLDHSRAGTGVWLFQLSQYRALSGCHFPVAFQADFWLGDSGGDHCEHPGAPAHQITRSTVSFDAASSHRVDALCSGFPGCFGNLRCDIIPAPVRECRCAVLSAWASEYPLRTADATRILFIDESRLDRDARLA